MRWPWAKNKPEKKYHAAAYEEWRWRGHWFNITSSRSQQETCQCEYRGFAHGWKRDDCHIHGPDGKELYDTLKCVFQRGW